ncbi:MAGUK p55 subfamily member 4 [Merluccius polli]|uniref:MAGUK p55 subfamily member 4 n=1 Tax=Merluccius polli TaxID=89951 RepID=A0AA47NCA6_MERPO|nr:MAGUK p55 subfamily member 4 [Merluccius polli]
MSPDAGKWTKPDERHRRLSNDDASAKKVSIYNHWREITAAILVSNSDGGYATCANREASSDLRRLAGPTEGQRSASMRQAVEAQVLTAHCGLGLRQVLVDVMEEVKQSVDQEVSGAELLHSLLESPWLQALMQVSTVWTRPYCRSVLYGPGPGPTAGQYCMDQALLQAFECLHRFRRESPAPALTYASGLSLQLLIDIRSLSGCSDEARELYSLLRQPHIQALLSAHDTVAQKDYEPVLPPMPEEIPDDEEATRTVCLVKNKQPLGATIKRNEITGEIFVARVIHGGLAERSGLLHAGDRIIEVNGFPVDGMEPEQVIQVVQARSHGTIMFKVVPITERPVHSQTMLYMRAMADYSPQQDPSIPCADAGMGFKRGDVLEIVDQTDALWWQAKKLPSTSACAGLVPSTNLLRRKQREHWWSQPYQLHNCAQTYEEAFESAGFRRSIRLCRRRSHSTSQPSCTARCAAISTAAGPYEEVVRYQRRPNDPCRLVALIGASGVGVNELRRRLVAADPHVFQGAIPHTTRVPRSYEESGREYYFTSREVFDNMVYNNRFLEYGDYKGSLYGTSIQAVKAVLSAGKICVIDIEPNAIQAVRTHELKAYVIYVKPPSAERLRETRQDALITTNYYVNRPFKDEDFQEMEEASRKLESHYCQFFDRVIVSEELEASGAELLVAARQAQDEPQWVPATWIRPPDEA